MIEVREAVAGDRVLERAASLEETSGARQVARYEIAVLEEAAEELARLGAA
jgi:hypothetical protein